MKLEVDATSVRSEKQLSVEIEASTYLVETDTYLQKVLAARSRRLFEEQQTLSDHDLESRLHAIECTMNCLEKLRKLM